jgi:hypothetical protein
MIKKGDYVVVDLDEFDKVKEFGNYNEIIERTKNGMTAVVISYNYKRWYTTIKFEDGFLCGIYESALKII